DKIKLVKKVTTVPINTYQVHAIEVPNLTHVTTASPVSMPAIAWFSRTRLVSVPSKNTPSSAPNGIDAIASPASSTEPHCRASSPIHSSTSPQPTVAIRLSFIDRSWLTPAPG